MKYTTKYQKKVLDFVHSNTFKISNTDQTHTFQTDIGRSINNTKVYKTKNKC
jgi:hypothetical protein